MYPHPQFDCLVNVGMIALATIIFFSLALYQLAMRVKQLMNVSLFQISNQHTSNEVVDLT